MFRAAVGRNPAENPDSPAPPIDHIIEAGANQQIAADRAMADRMDGRQPPKAAVKYVKFDWRAPIEHKLLPILRPFKPMMLKNMDQLRPTVTTYQELKKKESNVDAYEKLIEEIESYEYQVYQEQEKQQRQTEEVKQEDKDSDAHPLVIPLNPEELRINECLESLKKIFTMIDEGWLRKCIEQRFADKWDLEKTTSWIFDNLNVAPRKPIVAGEAQLKEADMDAQRERLLNTIRDVDQSYKLYAHLKLTQKFNRISFTSLHLVQRYFRYMYLPSVVLLAEGICLHLEKENKCWYDYRQNDVLFVEILRKKEKVIFPLRINDGPKNYNRKKFNIHNCPEILKMEVEWAERYLETIEQRYDRKHKQRIMERRRAQQVKQAVEKGEALECQVCCENYVQSEQVKCESGHIFCGNCLRRQCVEVVNGAVQLTEAGDVPCMEKNCPSFFTELVLSKHLNQDHHDLVDERRRTEMLQNLTASGLSLSRCPFCQYAMIIEAPIAEFKVFTCRNQKCKRKTCRQCLAEWKNHEGVPCTNMATDEEEVLRKKYEDLLSLKKIRLCHKCGVPIVKNEGCNKMTCRCGAKLCYLCRAKDIEYNHFCQHHTNPGQPCEQCSLCRLYEDAEGFDKRQQAVINQAREVDEWRLLLQTVPKAPAAAPAPK